VRGKNSSNVAKSKISCRHPGKDKDTGGNSAVIVDELEHLKNIKKGRRASIAKMQIFEKEFNRRNQEKKALKRRIPRGKKRPVQ